MNLDISTTIRSLLLAVVAGMTWTAATVQASFPTPYTPASEDSSQYATITHPGKVVVTGEADPGASVSVDGRPAAARQGRYFADEIALDNTTSPVAAGIDIAATLGAATETRSVEASVPSAPSSLEYDADGNLAFDGRNDYTWDAENRLVEIQTRTGHETIGAVFPSFRQRMDYADLGRRVRSRTWHQIGGTQFLGIGYLFLGRTVQSRTSLVRRP